MGVFCLWDPAPCTRSSASVPKVLRDLAGQFCLDAAGTQVGKLVTRLWMGWGNSGAWIGDHVLEYGHRCGCIPASIGLGMCRH